MKQLFLLRHAKSSWDDLDLSDFERPLNERGEKAAPKMGKVIKEREVKPDLILCSPARRTKDTLNLVVKASGLSVPVNYCDEIYEASIRDLIKLLHKQDSGVDGILMIGHNPAIQSLLFDVTGKSEHFPTACLAHVEVDIKDWKELGKGTGRLNWIARPKELD